MRKTDINYRDQVVDGEMLRKAMNSGLKVLGEQGLHSLFYDLESHGISLEKGGSCSLREVCKILNDLFGYEAADLMMERIYKKLQ